MTTTLQLFVMWVLVGLSAGRLAAGRPRFPALLLNAQPMENRQPMELDAR